MRSALWLTLLAVVACQRPPSSPQPPSFVPAAKESGSPAELRDIYYLRAGLAEQMRTEKHVTFCGEGAQPDAILQNTHNQFAILNVSSELSNASIREAVGEQAPALLPTSDLLLRPQNVTRQEGNLKVELPSGAAANYTPSSLDEIKTTLAANDRCLDEVKRYARAVDLPADEIILENLAVFERASLRLAVENAQHSEGHPRMGIAPVLYTTGSIALGAAGVVQWGRASEYARKNKFLKTYIDSHKLKNPEEWSAHSSKRAAVASKARLSSIGFFALAFLLQVADRLEAVKSGPQPERKDVLAHAQYFEELMRLTDAEFRSYLQAHPDQVRFIVRTIQNFTN